MRLGTLVSLLAAVSVVIASASCSDAKGTVSGGDPKFDAAVPVPPEVDAGPGDGGTGDITWTGLYKDFFGAPAPGPGCSGEVGNCHGTTNDPGSQSSLFTCGATKDDCYKGITDKTNGLVDPSNPPSSGLLQILRHNQNGVQIGSMPKRPATYFFSPDAIKRVQEWMAAGAKND